MKSDNRKFIPEIDELRALAALIVIFYHGQQLIGAYLANGGGFDPERDWIYSDNPFVTLIAEGHTAVGLFIVMSGYILSTGAIGKHIDYGRFIIARILRIYPVYLLLLAVAMLTSSAGITVFFSSVLPLPLAHTMIVSSPFSSMFWAVLVEFQCYLLFPFIIHFSNASGTRYLFGLVLVMIALRAIAVFGMDANARDLSYWTVMGRLDQFLIGMILARIAVNGGGNPYWRNLLFPLATALALLVIWLFNQAGGWPSGGRWKILWPDIEAIMWAMFIWSYLSFAQTFRFPGKRFLQLFGLVSYPIYLVHIAIITLTINNGLFLTLTGNPHHDALLTTLIVIIPLSVGIGTLLHHVIEKPFLSFRPKYVKQTTA